MAYRLKPKESVPDGLKRIAREELQSAIDGLTGATPATRDTAIHEARKSLKKTRAIVKLMRDELGGAYRTENQRLRDIGRRLSALRDARAILDAFDHLRGKHRLSGIRRGLAARQKSDRRILPDLAGKLTTARNAADRWPLRKDGFPAIAPGLEATFRAGRKTFACASRTGRPEDFHEWRKRVKDHWYHVRLLEDLWTDVMKGYEKSLNQLETWLGDDHNLVVLHDLLTKQPKNFGPPTEISLCLDLIAKSQKKLRKSALSLGELVYEEKPSELRRRMRVLWRAWRG
jgi:CHAD domain-containing protein